MDTIHRVAIVGVTGFLGRALPTLLAEKGIAATGVSRAGQGDVPGVDVWQRTDGMDFTGCDAVINLAGESLDRRWTEEARRSFHESRVGLSSQVVETIGKLSEQHRPRVLINASAVGFYGDRGDELLTENSRPGRNYLAGLCQDWEHAAQDAEILGLRVVKLRIGVVLGKNGPAYQKLRTIFRLGIGGRLGSGKQWMPWIHVDDLRSIIVHALFDDTIQGPINGCAPAPERNRDLTRKLAASLNRPAILPVPAFALKLILGEFSSALLASQRVIPTVLEANDFHFRYPKLEDALEQLALA